METRDTTYEERATWGECPICHAKHGEPCDPGVGFPLGMTLSGRPPTDGAHLGRLNNAPRRVKLVPA